ncbi:MAG: radical SAM protein [Candidatus Omnitrophota bacterium]|jgi:radical SAM superfamily enzyme YgiQ (UPF0313 family)|nr:MAG: radical SAM protein [Candidatus Omnitrophota bacterium]
MDVTIVNFGLPAATLIRPDELFIIKSIPVGALSIATVLKKTGYNVVFKDYQLSDYDDPLEPKNIIEFLSDSSSLLCIGCACNLLPFLVSALKKIKEKIPDKKIVLGGPGPSDVFEFLLRDFPFLDYIVRGEGEFTIVELVAAIENQKSLENIEGLSFRDNGNIIHNPARRLIARLDDLPDLDISLLNPGYNMFYIFTARGCPYDCTYCNNVTFWQQRVRPLSIRKAFNEIGLIRDKFKGINIAVGDDTFGVNKDVSERFIEEYKRVHYDFAWSATYRIDLFDEMFIKKMAAINMQSVVYGVESGSNRMLKRLGRNYKIEDAINVVSKTLTYLKTVAVSFIYGYPFETVEDFLETLESILKFHNLGVFIRLNLLGPLRQTRLFKEYKGGLENSSGHSYLITPYVKTKIMRKTTDTGRLQNLNKIGTGVPEVDRLIKNFPDSSVSYYLYPSDLELKEQIIKEFLTFIENAGTISEKRVSVKGYLIYFSKDRVKLLKSPRKAYTSRVGCKTK